MNFSDFMSLVRGPSLQEIKSITFTPLKEIMKSAEVPDLPLGIKMKLKDGTNVTGGWYYTARIVAKYCMMLECSVCDVIDFKGLDILPEYRERARQEFYPPVYGRLTYEPLRQLMRRLHGDMAWSKELKKFCREACFFGDYGHDRIVIRDYGYERIVVRDEVWNRLMDDKDLPLVIIYRICSILHCTPDYIIDYN